MCVSATIVIEQSVAINQEKRLCLIYILIATLFLAHMEVNVGAILDFFLLNFLVSMFITAPLSYYKYVMSSATYLEVYL